MSKRLLRLAPRLGPALATACGFVLLAWWPTVSPAAGHDKLDRWMWQYHLQHRCPCRYLSDGWGYYPTIWRPTPWPVTEWAPAEQVAPTPGAEPIPTPAEPAEESPSSIRREAARREAAHRQAVQREATLRNMARQEVARREEVARQEAARQEAARREAAQRALARQESARREAAQREAARREAPRLPAQSLQTQPTHVPGIHLAGSRQEQPIDGRHQPAADARPPRANTVSQDPAIDVRRAAQRNQEIATLLADRLRNCPQLADTRIVVRYLNGAVQLEGRVSHRSQVEIAEQLIRYSRDVERVSNRLRVDNESAPAQR